MANEYKKLLKCKQSIEKITDIKPVLAIVLGSGLSNVIDCVDVKNTIFYKDLKDFPVTTSSGHKGNLVFGYINEIPVVVLQGRIHYYEGYNMLDVVLPIRLVGMLGVKNIILTNSACGINTDIEIGDLMIIKDHISSFVPSPLIGENHREFGVRIPSMNDVYNKYMCEVLESEAKKLNIPIESGVYLQVTGPNYETPSESKMYSLLGADAVGMSTACEAIVAKHMGMNVCGISCISNKSIGTKKAGYPYKEVRLRANAVAPKLVKLIEASINKLTLIKDN